MLIGSRGARRHRRRCDASRRDEIGVRRHHRLAVVARGEIDRASGGGGGGRCTGSNGRGQPIVNSKCSRITMTSTLHRQLHRLTENRRRTSARNDVWSEKTSRVGFDTFIDE